MPDRPSSLARPDRLRVVAQLALLCAAALGLQATLQRGQVLDAQPTNFWEKGTFEAVLPDLAGARQVTLWTDAPGRAATQRQYDLQYAATPSAVSSVPSAAEAVRRLAAGQPIVVQSTHGRDHAARIATLLATAEAAGLSPRVRRHPRALAVVLP